MSWEESCGRINCGGVCCNPPEDPRDTFIAAIRELSAEIRNEDYGRDYEAREQADYVADKIDALLAAFDAK